MKLGTTVNTNVEGTNVNTNVEEKFSPLHAVAYRGSRGIALHNFNVMWERGALHAPAALTPGKNSGTH